MTLKPPTRTLPKLVMKDWPEKELVGELQSLAQYLHLEEKPYSAGVVERAAKALSDFTRVGEGVRGRPQKEGPPSNED